MYSPTAYHVFSSWGFSTARAIVEARPGKIVFDSYDCLGGGLQGQVASESQAQVESEKFCFEHADATCHRSSNWYVRRRYGYKMAKPIFFPEYSWGGDENLGIPKKPKRTDGIHCLYVGSVEPQNFNDPTKRTNVHDAEFVRSLTDRGVHYHIFPWVYDPDPQKFLNKYAPMLEEQVRNPLFHLHPPHQYEIMMEEISALHFGIIQVSPDVVTNGNHYYTANVFRHTTMNKVFDYIDADLFTLSFGYRTAERVLRGACEIVPRMEVGEWASKITPQEFKKKFLPRIPHVVDRLSVVKQARRLASFYESL
jgi:hypothetical protein